MLFFDYQRMNPRSDQIFARTKKQFVTEIVVRILFSFSSYEDAVNIFFLFFFQESSSAVPGDDVDAGRPSKR